MDQADAIQDDAIPEEPIENLESVEEPTDEIEADDIEADEPEIEYAEVEYNGVKYNVPSELKDSLMMQADYTKKTQDVAAERQALEQQVRDFQQAAQVHQQNMQGHAQLAALNSQLEQYNQVNWQAYSEQDPAAAQQAFFQYTQLKDAATNLHTQLQQQEAQSLQQQQQNVARLLEQGRAELARDIPGWSTGVEQQLIDYARQHGAPEQALKEAIAQPYQYKLLHKAFLYDQSVKQATQPKSNLKPVSRVKGKTKVNHDPDKMSTDEWLKWRNKQVNSR